MYSLVAFTALALSVNGAAILQKRADTNIISFVNPPPRLGGSAASAPCGGFSTSNVQPFPSQVGEIALSFSGDVSDFQLTYAPIAQNGDASAYRTLLPDNRFVYPGTVCQPAPNMTTLGFRDGDRLTISASGLNKDGDRVYTCADVALLPYHNYTRVAPQYTCINEVSDSAVIYTSTSDDAVSPVGAGFIGFGVTTVVIGLILAALFFFGWLKFVRRGASHSAIAAKQPMMQEQPRDDASSGKLSAKA